MTELQKTAAKVLDIDPALPVIEFQGRTYNRGEVRQLADQLDRLLIESGADRRAPVVFIARNQPASLAALLGLLRAGRTIRMVYPFQSDTAIAANVEKLKPAIVVAAEGEYGEEVRAALRTVGSSAIVISEMEAHALPGFERSTTPLEEGLPLEPQVEVLTSGTTGPPKHFPISYDTIARHFVGGTDPNQRAAQSETELPVLAVFPLGNVSGIYAVYTPLLQGRRIELLERFNPQGWRDYIVRYRPERMGMPSAIVPVILDAGFPPEDLASVKYYGSGAAYLDPEVHRAFEAKYAGKILLSYGATEFAGPVTMMDEQMVEEWGEKKFGSVGRALGENKIRVVDPDTHEELSAGEEGLLEVFCPRIGTDWIRTSDLAMIDEDDFMFHRGRADGAIMRGGFKVLPETIEKVLVQHPAVAAVAVAGKPDRRLGQVPVAAIVLKPEVSAPSFGELEAHLREHVLATHIPVAWKYVEALPRNLSMKIDRRAVAGLFETEDAE
ncbi:MAG TPA: fatty acid--CoA ligase family protein [Novosphingobium sp.]|nr:fatty acid--CoA ligase family protein [Novosphingobium sp.]